MTTFDRLMQNSKFKAEFEKGYNEFLISEFMIEKMEEENISVRELAKQAKLETARLMLQRNYPQAEICLMTGLTQEEVAGLN